MTHAPTSKSILFVHGAGDATLVDSLKYVASNFNNPPAVPFEDNRIPVIVFNQENDRMINPEMTRRNYESLGGEKKYMLLEGFEHWSNDPNFWNIIVSEAHNWFQKHATTTK